MIDQGTLHVRAKDADHERAGDRRADRAGEVADGPAQRLR